MIISEDFRWRDIPAELLDDLRVYGINSGSDTNIDDLAQLGYRVIRSRHQPFLIRQSDQRLGVSADWPKSRIQMVAKVWASIRHLRSPLCNGAQKLEMVSTISINSKEI